MASIRTYLEDSEGEYLEPSQTGLVFRAWLDHGPGSSEEVAVFVGPTKCGRFDALWINTDSASAKDAVAWIPSKQLSGTSLWVSLLEAYWSGERDENDADRPNYDEIIADPSAIATKEQLSDLAARVWPNH
jgi:hypothetical protein